MLILTDLRSIYNLLTVFALTFRLFLLRLFRLYGGSCRFGSFCGNRFCSRSFRRRRLYPCRRSFRENFRLSEASFSPISESQDVVQHRHYHDGRNDYPAPVDSTSLDRLGLRRRGRVRRNVYTGVLSAQNILGTGFLCATGTRLQIRRGRLRIASLRLKILRIAGAVVRCLCCLSKVDRNQFRTPFASEPKSTAIYQFFASRRSYGYALSQENCYLAPRFYPCPQIGS
jgi:hypothetical protein